MKLCKTCGNLLSDAENSCQKCGTNVEIVYVNNQQVSSQTQSEPQPTQVVQQSTEPSNNPKKNNVFETIKKNYKIISACVIIILLISTIWLGVDNAALRKKIKLNSTSKVDSSYEIKDNTNNTSQVLINADSEEFNFEIPEGTYPKVSQKYVFFVPESYVATILEQSGGLSLLNLDNGVAGWVAVNTATLEGYRKNQEALKTTYESQGIIVNKITNQVIAEKDTMVLELTDGDQATLLIIADSPSGDCFLLTISDTNNKSVYNYEIAEELVQMLTKAQKIG